MKRVHWMLAALVPVVGLAQDATDDFPEPEGALAEETADEAAEPEGEAVPERFMRSYFARRPDVYLVDPQELLSAGAREEQEGFLSYHASDSAIDFHVLLFGRDQRLPEGLRVEELAERFFGPDTAGLLALYFLEEPERARLQFSPNLRDRVPAREGARVLAEATRAASDRSEASEQLKEFCTQVSIRLFWVERSAGLRDGEESAGPSSPEPLVEEDSGPPKQEGGWPRALRRLWDDWGVPVVSLAGALGFGLVSRAIVRRRARFRFPEWRVDPRLGGRHGAGVGPVISFASSTRSPSSQKSGPSDSLGGI